MPNSLIAQDVGNEKLATLRTRFWETLGFGTQYAWMFCLVYGTAAYKSYQSVEDMRATKLVLAVGFALAYLVLFCLRKRHIEDLITRPLVVVAGVAGTLGTLLIANPFGGSPSSVVVAVAAVLAGASSALLMTAGNKTWAGLRSERVMMHVSVSALVASALYYVLAALPELASSLLICLLPAVGSGILASTKKSRPRAQSFRRVEKASPRVTARVLVFVGGFSLAAGAMLGSLAAASAMQAVEAGSSVAMAGALCASAFTFVCALRMAPTAMLMYLDRLCLPLMAIGFILCMIAPEGLAPVGFAFVMAGFLLADLFMWFLNAELVCRSGRSSCEVLARSCFVAWTGIGCGFAAACLAAPNLQWLNAACAIALIVVGGFVFTAADALRLVEAHAADAGEERLATACAVIAEQHALSPRESEVLALLANGRSVPYIQEKLTLSQSTVKTHVRNIYRKLEVNNKQALIDLVEEFASRPIA